MLHKGHNVDYGNVISPALYGIRFATRSNIPSLMRRRLRRDRPTLGIKYSGESLKIIFRPVRVMMLQGNHILPFQGGKLKTHVTTIGE